MMHVTKRDGTKQPVLLQEIQNKITRLSDNLKNVCPATVAIQVTRALTDGIETSKIDEITAEICMELYIDHTNYERLAVRILVDNMNRNSPDKFSDCMSLLAKDDRLDPKFVEVVEKHSERLDAIANEQPVESVERSLTFFGLKTLIKNKYLLATNDDVTERPTYMWLRVAIGIQLHKKDDPSFITEVAETFRALSRRLYTHATPTLFNAGTKYPQFASCFLMALNDDSVDGIYRSLHEAAIISKHAGGIGMHVHNLRAANSIINSTGCKTDGLMPMLRVFNESSLLVKQAGKRPGSIAIYMSPDHADIEKFINMRLNRGEESERCRDLFSGLWIPDRFMKQVIANGPWHLFSPDDAPGLSDVTGIEYDKLYDKYVDEGKYRSKINAQDLWLKIITSQIETGTPYMTYKDAANVHSNQSNVGTIKSSNLCTEIMEVSTPSRTAVCNLASICLSQFVNTDDVTGATTFDFDQLGHITRRVVRSLNHVIDSTLYPTEKSRLCNMETRPLGIGVQGWQTCLFKLQMPFDSDEAYSLNKKIFATIYFNAWDESSSLAETHGSYDFFKGSPLAQQILHCDTWDQPLVEGFDWQALREKVAKGARNSLITTIMPTASTAQICGNTEACEPQASNIYVRKTQAGEYEQINSYLVAELEKLGIWNKDIRHEIIRNDGSIQNIIAIPDWIKKLFRTAYEISQKVIINQARDRAPYIDQSQSMNLFLADPTIEKVSSMHIYAWKTGLKTGMYYLRSRPRTRPQQFAIAPPPKPTVPSPPEVCSRHSDCEACSA